MARSFAGEIRSETSTGWLPLVAAEPLSALLEELCEGAVAVDRAGRVVWISDKYRRLLRLPDELAVEGRDVEEILPESKLRQVAASGRPILLDIMRFGERQLVVIRLPLRDAEGRVTGAVGLVL